MEERNPNYNARLKLRTTTAADGSYRLYRRNDRTGEIEQVSLKDMATAVPARFLQLQDDLYTLSLEGDEAAQATLDTTYRIRREIPLLGGEIDGDTTDGGADGG